MSSKLTGKPGSVVDSHSSRPAIAHWLKQPTRVQYGPYLVNPYLALLRVEFTVPRTVASRAVRSYRTLSPLPDPTCVGHRRFALCCTGRGLAPPRRYLAPCPMEPGLSSPLSVSPEGGRQQSGDCLVSFGAQCIGFSPGCHSPCCSSAYLYSAFFFTPWISAVSAAAFFSGSSPCNSARVRSASGGSASSSAWW
ncbi:hypothetical protein SRABI13_00858 [Erwinia aphidicola]|nr:hypothetical protein SRABI13_00858 [Erwinia aphidicola]